jgi:hypothetical protein
MVEKSRELLSAYPLRAERRHLATITDKQKSLALRYSISRHVSSYESRKRIEREALKLLYHSCLSTSN